MKKQSLQHALVGLALVLGVVQTGVALAGDVDPAAVPLPKQTIAKKYLSAREAAALKEQLGNKALFVDVRTQAELEYVGMADMVDANVPYMLDDYTAWNDKNSKFLGEANSAFLMKFADVMQKAGLNKNSTVIVMCRSGDRSSRAVDLLTKDGYTNAYSVVDGFEGDLAKDGVNKGKRMVNGWKNAGLPWSYNLDKKKMYLE